MSTTQTIEKSSFQLRVDAAFHACSEDCDYLRLLDLILTAGELAAAEGLDSCSPLINLIDAKTKRYFDTSLRWLYERAFWSKSDQIRPEDYFDVQVAGPWCTIKSRGVAGGKGEVSLHTGAVRDFFRCVKTHSLSDYERWASNPYPVGGRTILTRMHSLYDDEENRIWPASTDEDGMLFIDPDTHPSEGRLFFGDPAQELQQIGALCQLKNLVVTLLAATTPSDADKLAAAERAATIISLADISFMPSSGYCSFCVADVTRVLANNEPGSSITGCPICGHTWCD